MKNLVVTLVIVVAIAVPAIARATPEAVSFTARIATADGPVDGTVDLAFGLFAAPTGGTAAWSDTQTVTADDGLVFATLGSPSNPVDQTVFTGAPMYLELVVEGETQSPRLAILSVPYALRAASAGSADTLGETIGPEDVVTGVTAGAGLSGGGSGGNVSLSVDSSALQTRVTGTCAAGSAIATIATDGNVTCESVGDVTEVLASNGLSGGGTSGAVSLAVDLAAVQARLGECPIGSLMYGANEDGSTLCDPVVNMISSGIGIIAPVTGGIATISVDDTVVARKDAAAGNQGFDTNTLFLDYTNNRVGVRTATPQYALDVNGDIQLVDAYAGEYRYRGVAHTNYRYIPGVAFHENGASPTWEAFSRDHYGYMESGTTQYLTAALDIPTDAEITYLGCEVVDNEAVNLAVTAKVSIYQRQYGSTTFTAERSFPITTTGASSAIQVFGGLVTPTLSVNNGTAGLLLVVTWEWTGDVGTGAGNRLYGCRVGYSMSHAGI